VELTKKRFPSADTSNGSHADPSRFCMDAGIRCTGNSAFGVPLRGTAFFRSKSAAIMVVVSVARKKSSRPSPRHRGERPPATETCHFPVLEGNEVIYTSRFPREYSVKANHFPSEENAPSPGKVPPSPLRKTTGLRSPDRGNSQRSDTVGLGS